MPRGLRIDGITQWAGLSLGGVPRIWEARLASGRCLSWQSYATRWKVPFNQSRLCRQAEAYAVLQSTEQRWPYPCHSDSRRCAWAQRFPQGQRFLILDNASSDRSHVARCSRAVRVTVSECCQRRWEAGRDGREPARTPHRRHRCVWYAVYRNGEVSI